MTAPTFPRIGGESTVFDAVTVTFRGGDYVATARRDGYRATRRMSYRYDGTPNSVQATAAAWLARCAMADKWASDPRTEGLGDLAAATHAEWTDPDRYAVAVSVEVPGVAYIVTFIPRELIGGRK